MAKRANTTTTKKKNKPALVKAAQGMTLPMVAKAARAIPAPAILLIVGACAVGALAMYLLDAESGEQRRALIRTKALQAGRDVSDIVSKGGRDVRQRLESVATQATKLARRERSTEAMNGLSEQLSTS